MVEATGAAGLGPATATCPTGKSLVGGGGFTAFNGSNNTKIVTSYPSDSAGTVTANGATNPTSWTASSNCNNATGATTTAVAVCATDVTVSTSAAAVTTTATNVGGSAAPPSLRPAARGEPSCSAGASLVTIGGGPGTGGQGIHMIGDYPSDGSGTAATSGSASAWTVAAMNGGQPNPTISTTAYPLCDTSSPTSPVPETPYPALMVGIGVLAAGGFVLYRRHRPLVTI